jgi:hypothetical protein
MRQKCRSLIIHYGRARAHLLKQTEQKIPFVTILNHSLVRIFICSLIVDKWNQEQKFHNIYWKLIFVFPFFPSSVGNHLNQALKRFK